MQNIAAENNLSETAFYTKEKDHYQIRWFTPTTEVYLCGHATLATAFVLWECENHTADFIQFQSPRSGALAVTKTEDGLTLDFPADHYHEVPLTNELIAGFNIAPIAAYRGKDDYLFLYENEGQIKDLFPDFQQVSKLKTRGVIVTAKGENTDFVSRFFAPRVGVNEDPVCGSAHTLLTPFWAKCLGKNELTALQLSQRQGFLKCKNLGDRVALSGEARLYLKGEIFI